MIPLTSNIIAVRVPVEAHGFKVNSSNEESFLSYSLSLTVGGGTFFESRNAELLGVIGAGEDDWTCILEVFPTAASFRKTMKEKGIDLTKEKVVIIKTK